MRYRHQYTVRGRAPFPHDMLRYDQSWPIDGGALDRLCSWVSVNDNEPADIELVSVSESEHGPTWDFGGRWLSFGWVVIKHEAMEIKL